MDAGFSISCIMVVISYPDIDQGPAGQDHQEQENKVYRPECGAAVTRIIQCPFGK